jgi:hypothetical protein
MQDQNIQALAALQASKQKGLTYYDAIQALRDRGFGQEAIDDASVKFDYQQGIVKEIGQNKPTFEQIKADEKQKLDQEAMDLKADEMEQREEDLFNGSGNFRMRL